MGDRGMKKCGNCIHRSYEGWDGLIDYCLDYEMTTTDEEEIEAAKDCKRYEKGDPSWMEDDCPSSTGGDYSPSNPWDAPGMSIRDFI